MELFTEIVSNVGFPIAVTGFLLLRFEKKIDQLNETLTDILELFSNPNINREGYVWMMQLLNHFVNQSKKEMKLL